MAQGFADLADLPEDERINKIIAHMKAQPPGYKAAVIVDQVASKVARYTRKLEAGGLTVKKRPGPVPNTTTLHVTYGLL